MQNKIILITGATGGVGKQTALALAKLGAQVIITERSHATGESAVAEIKSATAKPKVDLLLADLSKQKEIHSLAEQFKAKHDHLDALINYAGLTASKREITEDGIEAGFAANVIAPFLRTHLLMDSLKARQSARVINLMGGDVPAKLEMDNLQSERSFNGLS